jgi:hypothetical protein
MLAISETPLLWRKHLVRLHRKFKPEQEIECDLTSCIEMKNAYKSLFREVYPFGRRRKKRTIDQQPRVKVWTDGDWLCELCCVRSNTEAGHECHLKGKKHKNNLIRWHQDDPNEQLPYARGAALIFPQPVKRRRVFTLNECKQHDINPNPNPNAQNPTIGNTLPSNDALSEAFAQQAATITTNSNSRSRSRGRLRHVFNSSQRNLEQQRQQSLTVHSIFNLPSMAAYQPSAIPIPAQTVLPSTDMKEKVQEVLLNIIRQRPIISLTDLSQAFHSRVNRPFSSLCLDSNFSKGDNSNSGRYNYYLGGDSSPRRGAAGTITMMDNDVKGKDKVALKRFMQTNCRACKVEGDLVFYTGKIV